MERKTEAIVTDAIPKQHMPMHLILPLFWSSFSCLVVADIVVALSAFRGCLQNHVPRWVCFVNVTEYAYACRHIQDMCMCRNFNIVNQLYDQCIKDIFSSFSSFSLFFLRIQHCRWWWLYSKLNEGKNCHEKRRNEI